MEATKHFKATAADKREGMTLTELTEFVDECRDLLVDELAVPVVRVGWRGQVKSVEITTRRRDVDAR